MRRGCAGEIALICDQGTVQYGLAGSDIFSWHSLLSSWHISTLERVFFYSVKLACRPSRILPCCASLAASNSTISLGSTHLRRATHHVRTRRSFALYILPERLLMPSLAHGFIPFSDFSVGNTVGRLVSQADLLLIVCCLVQTGFVLKWGGVMAHTT